ETVVYQEKIGTLAEKVNKVTAIAKEIGQLLEVDFTTAEKIGRAAEISKFDLMTDMVNEFTELQGVMGEKYALILGEDQEVAEAIKEHYLPKHAEDRLPTSFIASIVSVADKLDTIVGCIAVGLLPSGSQDPYGLRRQANGILRILKQNEWDLSVQHLLDIAIECYTFSSVEMKDEHEFTLDLNKFLHDRALFLLKGLDIEHDVAQAVLNKGIGVLSYTVDKASLLSEKRNDDAFKPVQEALVRVLNLAEKAD